MYMSLDKDLYCDDKAYDHGCDKPQLVKKKYGSKAVSITITEQNSEVAEENDDGNGDEEVFIEDEQEVENFKFKICRQCKQRISIYKFKAHSNQCKEEDKEGQNDLS